MRNLVLLLSAMVVLIAGTTRGDWTEDWQNYDHSTKVDAPLSGPVLWDVAGTVGGMVWNNSGEAGIEDRAATFGAGVWTWGTAFRPVDGSEPNIPVVVTAKVMIEPGGGYHEIRLLLTKNTDVSGNKPADATNPYVELGLRRDGPAATASFHVRTAGGPGDEDQENIFIPADPNKWYEIRLTDNGDQSVTGEYKLLGDPTWTEAATIATPAGWGPTFVALSGLRSAFIDDISVTELGFLASDINRDFYMDLLDFALLVSDWLKCNDPALPDLCTDAVP